MAVPKCPKCSKTVKSPDIHYDEQCSHLHVVYCPRCGCVLGVRDVWASNFAYQAMENTVKIGQHFKIPGVKKTGMKF